MHVNGRGSAVWGLHKQGPACSYEQGCQECTNYSSLHVLSSESLAERAGTTSFVVEHRREQALPQL